MSDTRREVRERLRGKAEPAILFIGNSYSFGVPAALGELASENGRKIRTGHSTHSGWTLARHAQHDATLRKIRSGRWDVIVLQEYSLNPSKFSLLRDREMFPAVRSLVAEINAVGAIPVLYQTWGRRDSFATMNPKVRDGYLAASRNAGGVLVVPVGDYWEREINKGRGNELFQPDGSHPTRIGNRLTATAFYDALFR
jgi:hypothetical protein